MFYVSPFALHSSNFVAWGGKIAFPDILPYNEDVSISDERDVSAISKSSGIDFYRDPNLPIFEIKSCQSGIHATRKHTHEEFSVGLVTGGASLVNGAGLDFSVQKGTVIIIPPGMIHQCSPENFIDWRFQMLYLKADWVFSWLDALPRDLSIAAKSLNVKDYNRLIRLFRLLRRDIAPLRKEAALILELTFFFDFQNYFQQREPVLPQSEAVELAHQYLQANFLEKVSLDDLAAVSGLSKYHLLRNYKKMYRTAPHSHQTMLRMNYAKQKVKEQAGDSITMIAQEAGFFDQSHFVKTFKQYYGVSPFDYRGS